MFGIVQERMFIVTTERLYNFKKNKIKRFININKLNGISKTMSSGKSEFAVHVSGEYDYRFICDRRDEVIEILKQRFIELRNQNVPIFGIVKGNLK